MDSPPHGANRVQEEYKQLLRARRMAKRRRSQTACLPCKAHKRRCRPNLVCIFPFLSVGCVSSAVFSLLLHFDVKNTVSCIYCSIITRGCFSI